MKKFTFKGFTLVEVLIVIIIVGILIAALLPRLGGAQGRSRDLSRQVGIGQIAQGVELLITDAGPLTASGTVECMNTAALTSITAGTRLVPLSAYLDEVPADPSSNNVADIFTTDPTCIDGEYALIVAPGGRVAKAVAKGESAGTATYSDLEYADADYATEAAVQGSGATAAAAGEFIIESDIIG